VASLSGVGGDRGRRGGTYKEFDIVDCGRRWAGGERGAGVCKNRGN